MKAVNVLKRDAVLGNMFVARLPDEGYIAGVGGLESPGQKG